MKKLYKFSWDCGRSGDIESTFSATPEELSNIYGKSIGFGEILGKHSDIYGIAEESDFSIISENPEFVKEWDDATGGSVGYNPLDYYYDEDEDYDE